jgi:phage terminase large subunit
MLKVHTVWDLGFNDRMSIIFVQRLLNQLMVIDFLEDSHKKYDWYVSEIRNKRYNLGKAFVPHDAAHDSPLPIDVPAVVLRKLGLDVAPVLPREGLEIGIKRTRMAFNRIFFDEVKAAPLVEHLRRYRRAIPTSTNEARSPLHDEHSHAADALRYMILAAPNMVNEEDKPLPLPRTGIV